MIRIALFLLLLLVPTYGFSQFNIYLPNGKKLPYKNISINGLTDSLKLKKVEGVSNPYGEVFYKKLTNIPVFLLFSKKDDVTKIPAMLKFYNYNKYIYSYSYYFDLKSMMQDKSLTKEYLLEAFGKPSATIQEGEKKESWVFKNNNAKIEFDNDSIAKVDVINYKAYELHKLAITNFEITGEEYSLGFDISILNLNKKTIKYIFLTVTAVNPVDDKIGTKTVRAIGPVRQNQSSTYNFENIFYTSTGEYLILDQIKIQFMDGSVKQLNKGQIRSLTSNDWEEIGNRTLG